MPSIDEDDGMQCTVQFLRRRIFTGTKTIDFEMISALGDDTEGAV
jgi:hypothetical protein